jgi:DNA-binding LacI/PurR family transcriptional regulator
MVTRKDVAEHAGVSEAVVSYVLNNKQLVKESTRRKVLEAIEQLGYRPNQMARSLKRQRTEQIAVLMGAIGNPFEAGILLHVESTAQELGYIVFFHSYKPDNESKLIDLLHGRVDGVVVLGHSLRQETLEHFGQQGIPVMSLLTPAKRHTNYPVYDVDWVAAMRELVKHLLQQGHRRVGLIAHASKEHYLQIREDCFRSEAEAAGLMCDDNSVIRAQGNFESAEHGLAQWLGLHNGELPVTAIIGLNDLMAMGALSACRQHQLQIPEQMAVVGCEGILLSSQTNPPMTTLVYPRFELGREGMKWFIQRLKGEEPEELRSFRAALVIRSSG